VASVRLNACMRPHVLREVVTAVERFVANSTTVRLVSLVLLHMTDTIVLTNELSAAVVARVRSDISMRPDVSLIARQHDKSAFTLFALEWFTVTGSMSPFMHLKIPVCTKLFGTHITSIRFVSRVNFHVLR
jgi:hypothetical protein